jgi:hypothetical protein
LLTDDALDAICAKDDICISPMTLVIIFKILNANTVIIEIDVRKGGAKVEGDARSGSLTPFVQSICKCRAVSNLVKML